MLFANALGVMASQTTSGGPSPCAVGIFPRHAAATAPTISIEHGFMFPKSLNLLPGQVASAKPTPAGALLLQPESASQALAHRMGESGRRSGAVENFDESQKSISQRLTKASPRPANTSPITMCKSAGRIERETAYSTGAEIAEDAALKRLNRFLEGN